MKYVTHETWEDEGRTVWALTVVVRRWWAPWTWKRIELLAETSGAWCAPNPRQWVYRATGENVYYTLFDSIAERATALLDVTLIERRRIDKLLDEDEPPKLRVLTGGQQR